MLSWAAAIVARVIGLVSGPYGPWLGGAALLVVAAIGVWHYTSAVADAAAARADLAAARSEFAALKERLELAERARDAAILMRRRAAAAAQEADRRAAAIRAELVELRRALGSGGCEAALALIRRRQETAR